MKITNAASKSIRSEAKSLSIRMQSDSWAMAELLFKVSNYLDEAGNKLYVGWGYTSFADYIQGSNDIAGRIARVSACRLVHAWEVFQVRIRPNSARDFARTMSPHAIYRIGNLVDNNNIDAWLTFANTHTQTELFSAASVAKSVTSLRNDPERALARFKSQVKGVAKKEALADVYTIKKTKQSDKLLASVAYTACRALKKETITKEQAVLMCLEQFMRLVRQGKAGDGWNIPAISIDEAAE